MGGFAITLLAASESCRIGEIVCGVGLVYAFVVFPLTWLAGCTTVVLLLARSLRCGHLEFPSGALAAALAILSVILVVSLPSYGSPYPWVAEVLVGPSGTATLAAAMFLTIEPHRNLAPASASARR